MSDDASRYDATHIQVLDGLEAIRRRPGMYVGSTGERGVHQLVFEAVGRAVNEVLAGRAGCVDVTLTADGRVCVADDGPGVPAEAAEDTDGPGLEALLTRVPAVTRPFGRNTALVGQFAIGPCVTNALSSFLTAEVRREGMRWIQEYARGVAVTTPIVAGTATGSGTTIAFRPDPDIFGTAECSFTVLAERFRELAFLNRSLGISLTDDRGPGGSQSVRFRFPRGARDFVAFLDAGADAPVHPDVIGFEWADSPMAGVAEVALRWCGSGEERVLGFANGRLTSEGGTHVVGFRAGVAAAVNAYARERRLLSAADPELGADRTGEGLTAVVSVKLDRPEFEGATRSVLGNLAVRAGVEGAVREHLGRWLEGHPDQAAAVIGRIGSAKNGSSPGRCDT